MEREEGLWGSGQQVVLAGNDPWSERLRASHPSNRPDERRGQLPRKTAHAQSRNVSD